MKFTLISIKLTWDLAMEYFRLYAFGFAAYASFRNQNMVAVTEIFSGIGVIYVVKLLKLQLNCVRVELMYNCRLNWNFSSFFLAWIERKARLNWRVNPFECT